MLPLILFFFSLFISFIMNNRFKFCWKLRDELLVSMLLIWFSAPFHLNHFVACYISNEYIAILICEQRRIKITTLNSNKSHYCCCQCSRLSGQLLSASFVINTINMSSRLHHIIGMLSHHFTNEYEKWMGLYIKIYVILNINKNPKTQNKNKWKWHFTFALVRV